ncbi:hypothetical protein ABTE00_21825, partial [Acinetobacter baumannii]
PRRNTGRRHADQSRDAVAATRRPMALPVRRGHSSAQLRVGRSSLSPIRHRHTSTALDDGAGMLITRRISMQQHYRLTGTKI